MNFLLNLKEMTVNPGIRLDFKDNRNILCYVTIFLSMVSIIIEKLF